MIFKIGDILIKSNNNFELLRNKNIIDILDGDKAFGEINTKSPEGNIRNAMPYLKGSELCDICSNFGLPKKYSWNGGAQSRWTYLDELLEYCISHNKVSELLSFLFSKEQFETVLKGHTPNDIDYAHQTIIKTVIEHINSILYFGGHEIVNVNGKFFVKEIGKEVSVAIPTNKIVNRDYIIDLSNRALKDVTEGNFDSAITKSRTLLEEVFCYVIEQKGESPSKSGDIGKLYCQVKTLYNMHQNKELDNRINGLLKGLEKIVSAIAEMRN